MATIRKRGAYQWQAQIRRQGYPPQSKTFACKADAEAWAKMVESEMDRRVWIPRKEAENTSLREALQRYLLEITPMKKGARQEASRIKLWMNLPLADRSLAHIRGVDIAAYRDERLTSGRSPITINNDLILLSHVFTVARSDWGMESLLNPVANVRRPKQPRSRDRRLAHGEEERLLTTAAYPLREMIVIALDTAMRAGEILALRWDLVQFTRRVAVLEDTKNGEKREVPLTPRAANTLQGLPRCLDGFVFPRIDSSHVSHRFALACKSAGVSGLRFHDLRHEATSRFIERGFNVIEVAAITGHKTLNMLKRYTHPRADDLAKRLL